MNKWCPRCLKSPTLIDAVDYYGRTVLHRAASGERSENEKVVFQLLAASPALLDAVDHAGWTVLHHAAFYGDEKVAFALLAVASPTLINTVAIDCFARCSEKEI